MSDIEVAAAVFGTIAQHTGFFPVVLGFLLFFATVAALRRGGWL